MDLAYKKKLESQKYYFIGNHSAIKTCTWKKKSLQNQGVCYKQKFYGINTHLCCQMSVAMNFCDQDCIFCWREHKNFPFDKIDNPKEILNKVPQAERMLISGLGGSKDVNKEKFSKAYNPIHFAISLTGESIYYPKLNELIKEIHKKNGTTFLVTNGQAPFLLKKLIPPTQLYISLAANSEKMFNKICKPLRKNGWQLLLKTLSLLKTLKTRTTIRLTLIKNINMSEPEKYAKILEEASPKFIEVKAYMRVGASRKKLDKENMPLHTEVKEFSKLICKYSSYKIIDEQKESRVILLMKEEKDRFLKI
ncbi:MAG TPA: 4-demethylwyosine synthase TYW1 [Candidatus Nanoarchaeia archaeon]|nr:4-demethylwyosine synthase TYW1 [Candidatus Nanoarchaeia archaeon]